MPALAYCPCWRLTPRRLLWLSRPYEVEPPAFLCAIGVNLKVRAVLDGGARFPSGD